MKAAAHVNVTEAAKGVELRCGAVDNPTLTI